MNLQETENLGQKIFSEKSEVLFAYLYGSFLKTKFYEDIDIGIIIKDDFKPNVFYEAKIAKQFEAAFKKNFDIRILNEMPLRFLYVLLKNSKLLFSRDDNQRVKFESRVLTEYLDLKPHHDRYERMRKLKYGIG